MDNKLFRFIRGSRGKYMPGQMLSINELVSEIPCEYECEIQYGDPIPPSGDILLNLTTNGDYELRCGNKLLKAKGDPFRQLLFCDGTYTLKASGAIKIIAKYKLLHQRPQELIDLGIAIHHDGYYYKGGLIFLLPIEACDLNNLIQI